MCDGKRIETLEMVGSETMMGGGNGSKFSSGCRERSRTYTALAYLRTYLIYELYTT